MIVLALAFWLCAGWCGLGRADVADVLDCDGIAVVSGLPGADSVPLGVVSLVDGLLHPATSKPAVPNAPARNVRRSGVLKPPSMSFLPQPKHD